MSRAYDMGEVRRAVQMEANGCTHAEIAAALGRSGAVRQLGEHLSRHGRPRRAKDGLPGREAEVRALAEGGLLPLARIAARLGVPGRTASRWLRRLGLPRPPDGYRVREDWTEARRESVARARSERCRAECAALGWPEVVRPAHARILAYLREAGPRTHREIAARLGWRTYPGGGGGRPGSLRNPDLREHLALLCRAFRPDRKRSGGKFPLSYLVRLPPRPAGRAPLYAVAPWLLARKEGGGR